MKFLTDRKEIANEINIKGTPVITMNIEECMRGYEHCYEGSKIQIVGAFKNYPDLPLNCTAEMFGDEEGNKNHHNAPWMYEKIALYAESASLTNSFGMTDVLRMVEWSNTRKVKAGSEVIVMFKDKETVRLRKMRIGKRVSPYVFPATVLEDVE